MKNYKQIVVDEVLKVMKEGGWDFTEALTPLLEWIYDCGHNECLRSIKEKQQPIHSDQYTDIISDGGIDPR